VVDTTPSAKVSSPSKAEQSTLQQLDQLQEQKISQLNYFNKAQNELQTKLMH